VKEVPSDRNAIPPPAEAAAPAPAQFAPVVKPPEPLRPYPAARPATAQAAELSFTTIASISQRSARSVTTAEAFRRMLLGPEKPARTAPPRKKPVESPYDPEEARKIADDLIRGKNPKILSPAGIADVIHALTDTQVQAMEDGDYKLVDGIRTIIGNVRTKYREKDRIDLHDSRLSLLKRKLTEAQAKLTEIQKL
jgi:hypothetical protein